ncbi:MULTISPECIES: terminase large subunit [unclassified Rhizobium]
MACESIIPTDLPLFEDEADMAVEFFDNLRLPDVPGQPLMKDAAGDWYRDIVRAVFGARDPETNVRMIRELFALVPKGQSKTTYSAGLMIVGLLMNVRARAEILFVGPTQAIAELAFSQAVGMIEADPDLKKRFHPIENLKAIVDLTNKAKIKVKTFDLKILTGTRPIMVLLDELHLLGRNPHATKVIRQLRGGLEKNPEGLLMIVTTQSDSPPAGAFLEELTTARKIRDGKYKGKIVRAMLPVLYEFPDEIARDPTKWADPHNWKMVMPNLGRSMWLDSLIKDWEAEKDKGQAAIRMWASQHLNIEIGLGLKSDGWPGAEFWERQADEKIDLQYMLENCEVIVPGLDGGGLDDLYGLSLVGREKITHDWICWSHAWCHKSVLERRQTIAPILQDFEDADLLTIVGDKLDDISAIVDIINRVKEAGLLACVAADPAGLGETVEALATIEITQENDLLVGIPQGFALMNAIKTTERKLANGTLRHAVSPLMDWCVSNLKIEPTATAIRATKQNAGDAKIDPAMAMFNAVLMMTKNPEPKKVGSVYEKRGLRIA